MIASTQLSCHNRLKSLISFSVSLLVSIGNSFVPALIPALAFGLWYCWPRNSVQSCSPVRSAIVAGVVLSLADVLYTFSSYNIYISAVSLLCNWTGGLVAGLIIYWTVVVSDSYHLLFARTIGILIPTIGLFSYFLTPAAPELHALIKSFNALSFQYEKPSDYHYQEKPSEIWEEAL